MTSLTTLFVVGPEEYVEFNESMGSKAFLEHIWDQSKTPLKAEETSASGTVLHSAGARISPHPPPRIEFPTVLRKRGRGNRYEATGKYISWEELKKRNPMALNDPPSLEEFVARGSRIGEAERLEPGAMLKSERRFKINKRPQGTVEVTQDGDGWLGGGSSQSIYATQESQDDADAFHNGKASATPAVDAVVSSSTDTSADEASLNVLGDSSRKDVAPVKSLRKSRSGLSLSARLGIDAAAEVPPLPTERARQTKLDKIYVPDRAPQSAALSAVSPARTPIAQTPLSASHPPPDTPMKREGDKKQMEIPATPITEQLVAQHHAKAREDMSHAGLMLDHGQRHGDATTQSGEIDGGPESMTKSSVKTSTFSPGRGARSQFDEMLSRLRSARSGFSGAGSSESIWAPKASTTAATKASTPVSTPSDLMSANPPVIPAATASSAVAETTPTDPKLKSPAKGKKDKKEVAEKPAKQSKLKDEKSLLDRLGPKVNAESRPKDLNTKQLTQSPIAKVSSSKPSGSKEDVVDHQFESKDTGTSLPELVEHDKGEPSSIAVSQSSQSTGSRDEQGLPSTDSKSSKLDSWSNLGNETLTSINWADDTDDESLPDLPADWDKPLSSVGAASQGRRLSVASSTGPAVSVGNSSDAGDAGRTPHAQSKDRRTEGRRVKKGRSSKRDKTIANDAPMPHGNGQRSNVDVPLEAREGGPRGLRIAGRASETGTAMTSKPYWERKSQVNTSASNQYAFVPPSAPRGMRIAGSAQAASELDPQKVPRKELFPSSDGLRDTSDGVGARRRVEGRDGERRNGRSVNDPMQQQQRNASLQAGVPTAVAHDPSSESVLPRAPRSRPHVTTNGNKGAFARLTRGVVDVVAAADDAGSRNTARMTNNGSHNDDQQHMTEKRNDVRTNEADGRTTKANRRGAGRGGTKAQAKSRPNHTTTNA